jgi:hypothetical protein
VSCGAGIDVGDLVGAGQQWAVPSQPDDHPGGDRVGLADTAR